MLRLTTSNRYEELRHLLLDDLQDAPADPFRTQHVIVPSLAIRRDLQLQIARRHGVCAGVDFPYLAQWLWERIAELVPVQPISPFSPARLTWRLYRLLGEEALIDRLPRLALYLRGADACMRLELAERVAVLFEQLITYRPDWLAVWSAGREADLPGASLAQRADEAWQAALWRHVTAELGTQRQHPAASFLSKVATLGRAEAAGLPQRAHLFALTALPPLYFDIVRQLANWMDIDLYVVNPCRGYWHDLVDARRLARLQARQQLDYHETGHPLLAAWGQQTQALLAMLLEKSDAAEREAFAPHAQDTLLARIQNGLLDLDPPAPGSMVLSDDDRSLEFHACHSLTRELEVLHDQLLDLLGRPQGLTPDQILVATPNLDAAAPLIDAVFGTAGRIPYSITGRAERDINPFARALLAALDVAQSRCGGGTVFGLLSQPVVAAAFDLDEETLDTLRSALLEAGVAWGLDADQRAGFDQPAEAGHTWRDALSRLLLGFAGAESKAGTVFAGILPTGEFSGRSALALGQLWRFIDYLAAWRERMRQPLTAGDWGGLWQEILAGITLAQGDAVEERRRVLLTASDLAARMAEADPGERFPAAVATAALRAALADCAHGGVPTGSVTFTALPSLRLLPYRVIWLLGMSDDAFPSRARPSEFDLMPSFPRLGDRQRREDDRNLFLDLLQAARDRLIVSWTGRSQRDNSPLPMAVPVAELFDFALAATGAPGPRLLVEHPLQPFSRAYFSPSAGQDDRLFSFDETLCAALRAASPMISGDPPADGAGTEENDDTALPLMLPPLFPRPLPPPDDAWRQVGIDRLQRFFRHPARFLLSERLGLRIDNAEEVLPDDDQLLPGFPQQDRLARRLVEAALGSETDTASLLAQALAGPELPGGSCGNRLAEREVRAVTAFIAGIRPWLDKPRLAPLPIELPIALGNEQWTLAGRLTGLTPEGLFFWRYAPGGVADFLAAWIEHLGLNALAPPDIAHCTVIAARDAQWRLAPVDDAAYHLADLLAAYRQGLLAPLPFYPRAAWEKLNRGGSQWRQRWQREIANPWWQLARRHLGGQPEEGFEECAHSLLQPLIDHLELLP